MSSPLRYSDVDHQIEKLKNQNLIIEDEQFAKDILATCGYSSLIKSYRLPYIVYEDGVLKYRDGVSFNQIYSLYTFDKNLRGAVISAMLDLEEHVKATSAEVLAEHFGAKSEDYLNYKNYKNKRKRKAQFTLSGILEKFKKVLETEKGPIANCRTKHGDVQPWILFRGVYFSTIVNFIDQFKVPEQDSLVEKLYDTSSFDSSPQSLRFLMMDSLFIAMEYRNLAAHGGRIYDYSAESRFRMEEIFNNPAAYEVSGFSLLLVVLDLFKYKGPYQRIDYTLTEEINRHCNQFPEDVTYLGKIMNINITTVEKDMSD